MCSPKTSRKVSHISPSVAYCLTALRMWGIRFSFSFSAADCNLLRVSFTLALFRCCFRVFSRWTSSFSIFGSTLRVFMGILSSVMKSFTPTVIRFLVSVSF